MIILRNQLESLSIIRLTLFAVLLFSCGTSKAQELFYPLWVRFPQDAVEHQLSAAACDTVQNMDILSAKERAFASARSQIEAFIKGSTNNSSDLSIPGIAIKEMADVEDGANRVICILAAINTQILERELARASTSSDVGDLAEEFERYMSEMLDGEWRGAPYPSPRTASEYYANAKALADNNEILRSLKAYERHFSFGPTYLEIYDEHFKLLKNHFDEQDIPTYYDKLIDLYPDDQLLQYMSLSATRDLTQKSRESELAALDSIHAELTNLLVQDPTFLLGHFLMMSIVFAEEHSSLDDAATLKQLKLADISSDILRSALESGQHRSFFFGRSMREDFEERFSKLDDALSARAWNRYWSQSPSESDLEAIPYEANGLAEPIAIVCAGEGITGILKGYSTRKARVDTLTPARRIFYSWDGNSFIDTGEHPALCNNERECRLLYPHESSYFEHSGRYSWEHVIQRTGVIIPRPMSYLPLCGWSGSGDEGPFKLTAETKASVSVNKDVWVKYVERSSGDTVGPHKIKVRVNYVSGVESAANPGAGYFYCMRIGCFLVGNDWRPY
jgi:hypothetical protein